MIHLATVVVAVVIVTVTALTRNTTQVDVENITRREVKSVVTEQPEPFSTDVPSEADSQVSIQISTPTHNVTSSGDIVMYPNVQKISENEYETSDSVETVTNWYRAEIERREFSVKNIVTTTVNGNDKNVVSASNGDASFQVDIEEVNGTTRITVN